MLTLVEAVNIRGSMLSLPLGDATSGIVVGPIDGLGPTKATLVSSSVPGPGGEVYRTSKREKRNLIFHFELPPNYMGLSVADRRRKLYDFFMPQTPVSLRFTQDDGPLVYINGRIESCDPDIFSEEPAVVVSIICFNPDFMEPGTVEVSGTTTAGSNELLIDYAGTVDTGINFKLNVDRTVEDFTIYSRSGDNEMVSLDFSAPLQANDLLEISTVPRNKYVSLTRLGTTSSYLYGMSPYSNWIQLTPGENYLRIYAEGTSVPFTITYTNRYGGL